MTITGDTALRNALTNKLKKLASQNLAFSNALRMLCNTNLTIAIGTEQGLINDSRNKSKTLTEFRGYHLPGQVYLFYTRYETLESLVSLCLHELCHEALRSNPLIFMVMNTLMGSYLDSVGKSIKLTEPFWEQSSLEEIIKHDDVHDFLPEEIICDSFAKAVTGEAYDRVWWRDNIVRVDATNIQ